jgi:hypothetical protein
MAANRIMSNLRYEMLRQQSKTTVQIDRASTLPV